MGNSACLNCGYLKDTPNHQEGCSWGRQRRTQRCIWCGYTETEHSPSDARRGRCWGYKAPDDDEGATGSGLKDSGQRKEFASGMVRDIESDKPAFELLFPLDVPYDKQMVTRVADHLRKGAKKYSRRNWEKANSTEEMERALAAAIRHLIQLLTGETDEDHAAAAITNLIFAETMRYKVEQRTGKLP